MFQPMGIPLKNAQVRKRLEYSLFREYTREFETAEENVMMQMWNGAGYIVPIVAFSLLYNIIKFLELETLHIRKTLLHIYSPRGKIEASGKVTA
jgi:hypothetical protein